MSALKTKKAGRPASKICAVRWVDCAKELPDSDTTVLVYDREADEPVWLGYHDGETWRNVDGARCDAQQWANLPEGPEVQA